MEEQMKNYTDLESDEMNEDKELSSTISKVGAEAALKAMQEYLTFHNIKITGPWRSTAEKRADRHMD
jgi:hypothetical protein